MALFKRKRQTASPAASGIEDKVPVFTKLLPSREYGDLAHDEAELRFWLPEACRTALDEVTSALDITEAFWLRIVFLMHLYGEHECRRMFAQKTDFYAPSRTVSRKSSHRAVAFSVAPGPADLEGLPPEPMAWVVPDLGKNMWPIKVLVPEQLKQDLQRAATKVDVALSVYVRELLLARLLGHALDRSPFPHFSSETLRAGEAWESGAVDDKEVPASIVPFSGSEITYFDG